MPLRTCVYAAARLGDTDAAAEILVEHASQIASAAATRQRAGYEREDALQDARADLFAHVAQSLDAHKPIKITTQHLLKSLTPQTALSIPRTTRERYRAVMSQADWDVSAARSIIDAGGAGISWQTFVDVHAAWFAESLDALSTPDEDGNAHEIVGHMLIPAGLSLRAREVLAALDTLPALHATIVRLRCGLIPCPGHVGVIPRAGLTWKAIHDVIGLPQRELALIFDEGIAMLRERFAIAA